MEGEAVEKDGTNERQKREERRFYNRRKKEQMNEGKEKRKEDKWKMISAIVRERKQRSKITEERSIGYEERGMTSKWEKREKYGEENNERE